MTATAVRVVYAAYSPRLGAVRWFEPEFDEAQALALDLVQVDADGIRRAYRRVDAIWWRFLHSRVHGPDADALRARLVEIRGPELVARAEACDIPNDYLTPQV